MCPMYSAFKLGKAGSSEWLDTFSFYSAIHELHCRLLEITCSICPCPTGTALKYFSVLYPISSTYSNLSICFQVTYCIKFKKSRCLQSNNSTYCNVVWKPQFVKVPVQLQIWISDIQFLCFRFCTICFIPLLNVFILLLYNWAGLFYSS